MALTGSPTCSECNTGVNSVTFHCECGALAMYMCPRCDALRYAPAGQNLQCMNCKAARLTERGTVVEVANETLATGIQPPLPAEHKPIDVLNTIAKDIIDHVGVDKVSAIACVVVSAEGPKLFQTYGEAAELLGGVAALADFLSVLRVYRQHEGE